MNMGVAIQKSSKHKTSFDVNQNRNDFPLLHQNVHGHPLVYLDNAATTQKPKQVIDTIVTYYNEYNANVHRGVHALSEHATKDYEAARAKVQKFINAKHPEEIVFVRGTTEAINLVATSYGYSQLQAGDEILITHMEHHSNIVPWQLLCKQIGTVLRVAPINDDADLDLEAFKSLITNKTKFIACVHASNALGTINPISEIIKIAHAHHIPVLVDGAQAAPHLKIDVQALDCDFYAISGHKMYGPTGIGALYAKKQLLESMPPYQGGGEMIKQVSFEKTTYNDIPFKFEAGTPNIVGAIGLGAAIDYIQNLGIENIAAHEHELLLYATKQLQAIPDLKIIGTAKKKVSVVSFIIKGIHAHDIGTILDRHGVAIRAGHYCAMPVMERFNLTATARASFALYNTKQEIETLVEVIEEARKMFL